MTGKEENANTERRRKAASGHLAPEALTWNAQYRTTDDRRKMADWCRDRNKKNGCGALPPQPFLRLRKCTYFASTAAPLTATGSTLFT